MSETSSSKLPTIITTIIVILGTPFVAFIVPGLVFGLGPPTGDWVLHQTILAVINGIAFSLGLAFTIFVIPRLNSSNLSDSLQIPMFVVYVTIAWELVSWGLHDWFHIASPGDFWTTLLNIELAFHVTLQTTAMVSAIMIIRMLRNPNFTNQPTNTIKFIVEMPHWLFMVIITAIFGTIGFFFAEPLTPVSSDFGAPPDSLGFYFFLLYIFDCITFGVGVAFIFLSFSLVNKVVPAGQGSFISMIIAVGWLMVAALLHVRLHLNAGLDLARIIAIDYAFHTTLITSAVIAARQFSKLVLSDLSK